MRLLFPAVYMIADSSVLPFPNKMHIVQSVCNVLQTSYCGPVYEPDSGWLYKAKHFLFPEFSQSASNFRISSDHVSVIFLLMMSYGWSLVTSPNPYKLKLNEIKKQKQTTKNNNNKKQHPSLITNYLLKTEQAMENK